MFAPPFFHLSNNTHFLVRKIFILDIEKNASDFRFLYLPLYKGIAFGLARLRSIKHKVLLLRFR